LGIRDAGFFSVGIHPWDADAFNEYKLNLIKELAIHSRCVAIGEIGLDKLKGPSMEIQIQTFRKQVQLAEEISLPVIIHCVKAWNELREIRRQIQPKSPWIYHGFSKASILNEVLIEGMIVSFGKDILNNSKLHSAIIDLPMSKMLFETDDSAIGINQVYELVSKLKKIPLQELEKSIEENIFNIFPKWKTGLKELNY
jgi:TatD DNase family protein